MTTWTNISEIPRYENFTNYCMNEHGEMRNGRGHIMKWSNTGRGLTSTISYNGHEKTIKQHRLLAFLFIPNPDNKQFVDHINGNQADNRLENLRWATDVENNRNKIVSKNSKTGHKNIGKRIDHGCPYWRIMITADGKRYEKLFSRNPDSDEVPDEVIHERDRMLAELHRDFASDRKTKFLFNRITNN